MLTSDPLDTESDAELTDTTLAEVASDETTPPPVGSPENLAENLAEIDLWATDSQPTTAPVIDSDSIDRVGELTVPASTAAPLSPDMPLDPAVTSAEETPTAVAAKDENNWLNHFNRFTALTAAAPEALAVATAEATATEIIAAESEPSVTPSLDVVAPAPPEKLLTEKSIHSAQRLSPFITLADSPALADAVTAANASAPLFYANGPSPIIYPLRPAKKLPSLAAVQLPSFLQSRR
jgi:hypothetical protein